MEQSNLQSLIYETDQAIQAGQAAHVQAQQALSTLRSAKGWGVYDLLGGGLLSGLIKHSRMDKAEQEIAQLRRALDRFNRELRDVRVRCDATTELSAFWRVTDIVWDNLFSDWTALSQISEAKEQVERTDASAEHTARCQQKLEILLQQRTDLSTAIDQLLEDFEAGRKYMKVYKQMKMYNDPSTNPVLYGKK